MSADVRDPKSPGAPRTRAAQQSIVIARPIQEVFGAASALEKRSSWRRGVLESTASDCGGSRVGTRCTETRRAPNDTTEQWELEITQFDEDRCLVIVATCGSVTFVERYTFELDQTGLGHTRYTLAMEGIGTSLTEGAFQKLIVECLINFRDCIENPNAFSGVARGNAARLRRM